MESRTPGIAFALGVATRDAKRKAFDAIWFLFAAFYASFSGPGDQIEKTSKFQF